MKYFIFVLLFASSQILNAKSLTEYEHYDYEVLFTNPVCETYSYKNKVYSNDNELIKSKPKNAFCKSGDKKASGSRINSPQYRIIEWLNDKSTTEVYMTFLSFSSKEVKEALCRNIQQRNLKLKMILDSNKDVPAANYIIDNCVPKNENYNDYPEIYYSGHTRGIGWAHNKLILVNPNNEEHMKIAYGSANLSSGVVLHHENWHFVTIDSKSYFAQAHLCLWNGMMEYDSSGQKFRNYMSQCRDDIQATEESDIKLSFIPGDGKRAFEFINKSIQSSDRIYMGAHRFSYNKLITALSEKLKAEPKTDIRLVADDDLYWVANDRAGLSVPNTTHEYRQVRMLENQGMSVRYMETNHWNHLLHHNKFMIFYKKAKPFAVHAGAGNFTGTAFKSNFENFYYIQIPEVVEAFNKQYEYLWDLASPWGELPTKNVKP